MKKKALKRMLKDALAQIAALRAPADAGLSIAAWLPTYRAIITTRGYNPQTVKNRSGSIKHIETLWGSRPLRALKPHEISVKLKLLTPPTAIRVLAELRDCYAEAIANGEADTSPAAHVKPPRHRGLRQRLTFETWDGLRLLSLASPQRWVTAMLLLAIVTGQRRADLAKMAFADVVDGHLLVEQQKKAGKPIGARVAIPLSLRMDAIGMTVGEVIEHCRGSAKPGPTLLRKAGGGPIEESSLPARFHECIVAVLGEGAHERFQWPSLHEVRSLSARMYLQQGLTAEQVQTLLGHKTAEMTALYTDDRGLTAAQWKQVAVPAA